MFVWLVLLLGAWASADPHRCHLKLACAAARSRRAATLPFLQGLRHMREYRPSLTLAPSAPCSSLAPSCPYSDHELLEELVTLGLTPAAPSRPRRQASPAAPPPARRRLRVHRRRQLRRPLRRQGGGMPPIFTPAGAAGRQVCRTCDRRRTVCTVYSVGTYAGCTGAWLMAGIPGQLACNVATAPGSLGCAMNTFHCYMESCGLVTLPRLP